MSKCIYTPKTLPVIDCKILLQGEGSKSETETQIKNSGRKTATNRKGNFMENITMGKTEKYHIDHFGKAIYFRKSFMRAASTLDTPEYKTLMALQTKHPDFTFLMFEISKAHGKEKYKGLNEAKVKDFLNYHYQNDPVGLEKAQDALDELMNHNDKYHKTARAGALKSWVVQNYKVAYLEWDKRTQKKNSFEESTDEQNNKDVQRQNAAERD